MEGREGAFVACSFWLAQAPAQAQRRDDAAEVIDGALALASPLGLMSEEFDPAGSELLGNFPQVLSHPAFLTAAALYDDA